MDLWLLKQANACIAAYLAGEPKLSVIVLAHTYTELSLPAKGNTIPTETTFKMFMHNRFFTH
jgi:hypothetical protein